MGEPLTREQLNEQLDNIHFGSVDVRLKSMQCIRNHDAALRAALDMVKAELHEQWIDDYQTVWTRPTAWAYAQVCKTLDRTKEQLAQMTQERDCYQWKHDELGAIIIAAKLKPQTIQREIIHPQIRDLPAQLTEAQATIARLKQEAPDGTQADV